MPGTAVRPFVAHVLVADDDPASRLFFSEALRGLGAVPAACADGTEALERARREAFDLLLLDCRMPGGGAREVLAALRGDPRARSCRAAAVATSAELGPRDRQGLLAAGFGEVLLKPCGIDELRRLLGLAHPAGKAVPLLDDGAALASTGDAAVTRALRGLLRQELAGLQRDLNALAGDAVGFDARLHRLRASCGFCGALALADELAALQRRLPLGPGGGRALAALRQALAATLDALEQAEAA
jgi:CheY-like chemotaxis protein